MGKKMSGKAKADRRARKAAARRQKLIRRGLIYLGVIVLCVVCLAVLAHIGRAPGKQDTWYIRNGGLEIAAPGMTESGLGTVAGAADAGAADDAASRYAIPMPQLPSRASAEPTASPSPSPTPTTTPQPTPAPTPDPTPVTITITAAGDCTLGGSIHQETYANFKRVVQKSGYDYFFKNVRPVFEADDLTILNLEGPLTDVGKGRRGSYCFKGDPDYVQIMTSSSVELCNVANNHSMDFGKEGLLRTAEVLEQAGIGCCGYTKAYRTTIKGVRVTALGFDKWQNNASGIVQAIRSERPNCDLLIVNMHWGREKHYEPMAQQKQWGHAAIDAGADLVIGTHPHVYGGVEQYKGRYIAYSLGNFCFGGNDNPSDKRCLMFQQTFVVAPGGQVSNGGINIIPCSVSGMAHVNNLQPVVMAADAGTKLLKAMATYSNLNGGTVWMPNSYPEQIGLLSGAASGQGARAVDLIRLSQQAPETAAETEKPGIDDDALVGALDVEEDEFEPSYSGPADADYEGDAGSGNAGRDGADAFGDLNEAAFEEETELTGEETRDIMAKQMVAGVEFSQEERRNTEIEAKQAMLLEQMEVG